MKTSREEHRNWLTAITFAEAGEWETARAMMPAPRQQDAPGWLQKNFIAIAFAEAGLHDEALRLLAGKEQGHRNSGFLAVVGLHGVRVTYGVLIAEAT